MSWKPYMKRVIDDFNDNFLLEGEYPELYTILKRSENFGQFFDSVEQYLGKVLKEVEQKDDVDWTTDFEFGRFLDKIDDAFAEYLEDKEKEDVE